MTRIALDAFGSDRAPDPEVQGAIRAVNSAQDLEILLVGPKEKLLSLPELREGLPFRITIEDSGDGVPMDAKPREALRLYKKSSLYRAIHLHKEGEVNGVVSAGNTGVIMAFSLFTLGRIPGIKRPAIAAIIPNTEGLVLFIDAGANSSARPEHLFQFAVMATYYMKLEMGLSKPRVGLLSVGTEETKGNPLIERALRLMKNCKELNFIGLIEGNDFFTNRTDIIVTDGFTGNVILKFGEGVAEMLIKAFGGLLTPRGYSDTDIERYKKIERLKKRLDYQEYGGAPLLGVEGTVIISHGRSTARAIETAILHAKKIADTGLTKALKESISHITMEIF